LFGKKTGVGGIHGGLGEAEKIPLRERVEEGFFGGYTLG